MKSKQQINDENAAMAAIRRNMRVFTLLLIIGVVLVYAHLAQILYANFVKFPETAFLGTTDAQSVCAPIGLSEPMVADAVARDFAVLAVRTIQTYDWTSWRDQINYSTSQFMTVEGRNTYRLSVSEWGIIGDVAAKYQNATASQRAPAQSLGQKPVAQPDGSLRYEWEIVVPMTLVYRSAVDRRSENRDFYVTVVRVPKSPLNPKGIAVGRLVSTQPVVVGAVAQ